MEVDRDWLDGDENSSLIICQPKQIISRLDTYAKPLAEQTDLYKALYQYCHLKLSQSPFQLNSKQDLIFQYCVDVHEDECAEQRASVWLQ